MAERTGLTLVLRAVAAILASSLVLLAARAAPADEAGRTVEIRLENVLWQALPDEVVGVLRGPDDRMWYQIAFDAPREDADAVKRSIEREFRRPSPHVVGARPGLFEPGGRVWFITQSGRRLMGYDGQAWIERDAGAGGTFRGAVPTGPVPPNRGVNACIDGRAFFPQWRGVQWFDGHEWSYKLWPMAPGERWLEWWLMPETDGRGALAVLDYGGPMTLWRWRDGRWAEAALAVTDREDPLHGAAPGPGGTVWVLTQAGQLYELGHAPDPAAGVGDMVRALGATDYTARETAQAALIRKGKAIQGLLEGRLAAEKDPEILYRLRSILQELKPQPAPPSVLGSCGFAAALSLASDLKGGLVVYASQIEEGGRKHVAGVILMDAAGKCRVLDGGEVAKAWVGSNNVLGQIRAPGGVWVPGIRMEGAQLFDPETGRRVAAVPDHRYSWVQAVAPDGTVFVSAHALPYSAPVVALRPGAPDTRKLLAPVCERKFKGSPLYATDAGGTAWLYCKDNGLSRFDGRQWQEVAFPGAMKEVTCLVTGGPGVALLTGDGGTALVAGERRVLFPSLAQAVEQETAELAKAFPAYRARGFGPEAHGLVGDRAGNLWVLRGRTLKVRTRGHWVDATEPLKQAGSRDGNIGCVMRIGEGRQVYLAGMFDEGGQWGNAFIGEAREGELSFYRAHMGTPVHEVWMPTKRDTRGDLWVPAQMGVEWWTGGMRTEQLCARIGESATDVIHGEGWPILCDLGGNVWMKRTWGQDGSGEFDLRRDDGLGGKVRVPTGDTNTSLMSDRPGSVYAWTGYGLCHMVADDPARPARFVLKDLVIPTGFEGVVMKVAYIQPDAILVETHLTADTGTGLYVYPRP